MEEFSLAGGNGNIEDLDPDVQDYSTDEDYNDVFDATTNGYVDEYVYLSSSPRMLVYQFSVLKYSCKLLSREKSSYQAGRTVRITKEALVSFVILGRRDSLLFLK